MRKFITLAAVAVISTGLCAAEEARLLRFPATNSQQVVFSHAGDLYTVSINGGKAQRLTSHVGYEMFARFSPDGKSIAFTGEYDGNREVYLIPSQGGEPVRLTYTATNSRDDLSDRMGPNNVVMTWNPDGKSIMFRNRISDGFSGKLWSVSVEGAMPEELPLPEGGFCSWSPDGKQLAYNRVFREFRTWKYYRGGMADDIWIYDPKAKKITNITENDAQDIFPMWCGDEIYFASDRDATMNLFVYNTKTKQTQKVTDFKEYDVKFPSTDGKTIVFENGGYIWKLDPKTKKYEQMHIEVASDMVYSRTEQRNVSGRLSAASMAPDGSRVAITARGEVFDVPASKGVTRNITRTPGSNDRGAAWSYDGKYIAYISDQTGETEIWIHNVQTGKSEQMTKGNDTYIRRIIWAPDSKTLLYTDRRNRIMELTIASKKTRCVLENPHNEPSDVTFSPDSKWIAYTKQEENHFGVIYLVELSSGKEYAATERWYNSDSPAFSSDGKYLIFSSDRDFNPTYSSIEWDYAYNNMGGVYMAMLSKDTPSPFLPKDAQVSIKDDEEPAKKADAGKNDKKKEEPKAKEDNSMKIDTDGLYNRIIKLPLPAGNYGGFYCDGRKVYYSGRGGTNAFNLETQKSDVYTDARIDVRYGAKKALFMKGRDIYVADFGGESARLGTPVSTADMVADIDFSEEWAQIYNEVWRAFRDGFYLENMHGADWNAIRKKYEVLVPYAKTRLDLNYIIGEMISEVGCGHAYVTAGEKPEANRISMGMLGAVISSDKSGYFRIDHILQGAPYSQTLRSPLAEPGLGVQEGEFITAVNGIPANSVKNIYQLLIGKAGVLTELTINSKAAEGGRKVIISPIADEYPLFHLEWIQKNIDRVNEATNGQVGYIYIPDMSQEGLNEFVRYFYPQLDKKALIIDDRANGGGNVSPMILERLQRDPYRMTMYRNSDLNGTIPEGTHNGPKVMLVNKYSASDGDLFPWSFKATKTGTIIGTRTWGGIVGISGSLPYMDGTDVRVPFFTNYDAKTGEWIVENHGVDPDILIDNDPILEFNGTDQQLEEAIKVALEQIKTDYKPLPKTPAPRTYKDLGIQK
ncbi:MAG: PDZ domain-containing protein [Bacteroidaceae bacterium]|nr:PDZ domain-containing protein [Bacteroidaceae bacterium]